jgi:hypothetical protein
VNARDELRKGRKCRNFQHKSIGQAYLGITTRADVETLMIANRLACNEVEPAQNVLAIDNDGEPKIGKLS